jgi:hypothetical protein
MTLKQFLLPSIPEWREHGVEPLMGLVDGLYNKILTLQIRLFSRLASIAEKVEEALGLTPLQKPTPDDKPHNNSASSKQSKA